MPLDWDRLEDHSGLMGRHTLGARVGKIEVTIPLKTEVIQEHGDLVTGTEFIEREGIFVDMDVRRAPWRKILNLSQRTQVHWADVFALSRSRN